MSEAGEDFYTVQETARILKRTPGRELGERLPDLSEQPVFRKQPPCKARL